MICHSRAPVLLVNWVPGCRNNPIVSEVASSVTVWPAFQALFLVVKSKLRAKHIPFPALGYMESEGTLVYLDRPTLLGLRLRY